MEKNYIKSLYNKLSNIWFLWAGVVLLLLQPALSSPTEGSFRYLFKPGQISRVGLEMEFGSVGFLNPQWGDRHINFARRVFAVFFNEFGGSSANIRTELWEKYERLGFEKVVYEPRPGLKFEIVPESVSSGGHDGFELVTPPFDNPEDVLRFKRVLKELKKQRLVRRGVRSSNHQTFDISHLMSSSEQHRLYDLILNIEANWPNIYRYVNPQRYGTIVNRFGVPLAANQQEMLKEIAATPRAQRTLRNLKAIFKKYEEQELEIQGGEGNEHKVWKYRAANYSKFLSGIPVLEFRIPDLDFGTDWLLNMDFLAGVISQSAQTSASRQFVSPFGDEAVGWQGATEKIVNAFDLSSYESYLNRLSIVDKETPHHFWTRLDVPSAQEREAFLKPMSYEYKVRSEKVTFGFEAEFKQDDSHYWVRDLNRMPSYMSRIVSNEVTGNTEIRSNGGETKLSQVYQQMTATRDHLGSGLRGFHLHIRIPDEMADRLSQEQKENWFSLIADYIWAWRLQNRNPYFALMSATNGRANPDTVLNDERATLRVSPKYGYIDVEIRGFMGDVEKIMEVSRMILAGFKNPDLVQTSHLSYRALFVNTNDSSEIVREVNKLSLNLYGQELTSSEQAKLATYLNSIPNLPPMLDLEFVIDLLSPQEIRQIRESRQELFRRMILFSRGDFDKMKYSRFVDYANSINLQEILKRSILRKDPVNFPLHLRREKLRLANESRRIVVSLEKRIAQFIPNANDVSILDSITDSIVGLVSRNKSLALSLTSNFLEQMSISTELNLAGVNQWYRGNILNRLQILFGELDLMENDALILSPQASRNLLLFNLAIKSRSSGDLLDSSVSQALLKRYLEAQDLTKEENLADAIGLYTAYSFEQLTDNFPKEAVKDAFRSVFNVKVLSKTKFRELISKAIDQLEFYPYISRVRIRDRDVQRKIDRYREALLSALNEEAARSRTSAPRNPRRGARSGSAALRCEQIL